MRLCVRENPIMILVLLGPPGVGKGTQGARIALHYVLPTISTGAMLREAISKGTKLGKIAEGYRIDRGEYVPDEIIVEAVDERIEEPDCLNGFLLDGFPRTIPQAKVFAGVLLKKKRRLTGVIDFYAPIDAVVKRFSGRRICSICGTTYHITSQPPKIEGICDLEGGTLITRPDDEPDVVQHRMEVYHEKTTPLRDYYRECGVLHTVDADQDPGLVFRATIELLNRLEAEETLIFEQGKWNV